ncbi:MAG: hypothetical protein HQ559_13750 [Lentisphaerae bacterium]|nr:hypothetical protein [Lentisphaerota bacterium]
MYRRTAFDKAGGFDASFRHSADIDMGIRVSALGTTVYLAEPFVFRRIHDTNLTWKNLAHGHITHDRAALFERFRDRYAFSPSEIRRFKTYLSACACFDILRIGRHRSVSVALQALGQIIRYAHPELGVYWRVVRELVSGRNEDAM